MNKKDFLYFYNNSAKFRDLHKAPKISVDLNRLYKGICDRGEITLTELGDWIVMNSDLYKLSREWVNIAEANIKYAEEIKKEMLGDE